MQLTQIAYTHNHSKNHNQWQWWDLKAIRKKLTDWLTKDRSTKLSSNQANLLTTNWTELYRQQGDTESANKQQLSSDD